MPLIFAFLTGLVLTAVLVPVVGGIARRFHLCATPSSDRWHTGVVPNIGGVAMFIPLAMARLALRDLTSRNMHWLYAFGRLAPSVSRERAEAVINLPFTALIRDVEFPALRSGMSDLEQQQFQQRTLVLSDGSLPRARDRAAIHLDDEAPGHRVRTEHGRRW